MREYHACLPLQNTDIRTRTIRLRGPKSKFFSVKGWQQAQTLAGGLETKFQVMPQIQNAIEHCMDGLQVSLHDALPQVVFDAGVHGLPNDLVSDTIMIQCESGEYELVVKAIAPQSNVTVVGDLCYGIVAVDTKPTKQFQLVNRGTANAVYRIDSQ